MGVELGRSALRLDLLEPCCGGVSELEMVVEEGERVGEGGEGQWESKPLWPVEGVRLCMVILPP